MWCRVGHRVARGGGVCVQPLIVRVQRRNARNVLNWALSSSTGAAAALMAAARRPREVRAIVSRGGRPDLAEGALDLVTTPTLLIVGGRDDVVVELNQQAYVRLGGTRELKIVPGATHLFEEPGALEDVSRLAADWFSAHL